MCYVLVLVLKCSSLCVTVYCMLWVECGLWITVALLTKVALLRHCCRPTIKRNLSSDRWHHTWGLHLRWQQDTNTTHDIHCQWSILNLLCHRLSVLPLHLLSLQQLRLVHLHEMSACQHRYISYSFVLHISAFWVTVLCGHGWFQTTSDEQTLTEKLLTNSLTNLFYLQH